MSRDPNSMLLDMMSPDQARLLDQQLRQKQLQQGVTNYGSDPLGRFLTSASGAQRASQGLGMLGQRLLTGERLKGAEELKAEHQQVQADAIKGATGKNRVDQLRDAAKRLRATGAFKNIVLAEQYETKADELAFQLGTMQINRLKALGTTGTSKGFTSTEGEHFKDDEGNVYATVLTTDKTTGNVDVKYVNLTGTKEYDGQSTLIPVIKSGANVGYTPKEAAELDAIKEGDIQLRKEFSKLKAEAAGNYTEAKSNYNDLQRALVLTKDLLAQGELEGGLQASAVNAIRKLTGKTPKSIAELNNLFGEATYARLKPLFGGVISDSERQAIEDLYFSISKSGEVNIALLERFIDKVDGAMTRYGILMTSSDFDDYSSKVLGLGEADNVPEEEANTTTDTQFVPEYIYDAEQGKVVPNPALNK